MITNHNVTTVADRSLLEPLVRKYLVYYSLIAISSSLIIVFSRLRSGTIPKIIKKQLTIFLLYIIAPLIISELYYIGSTAHTRYAFNTIYEIFMTIAIFYATKKIINIRFLNLQNHVHDVKKNRSAEHIKNMLEQLSAVSSLQELRHLTQSFFTHTFNISLEKTHIFFRATHATEIATTGEDKAIEQTGEIFISQKFTDQALSYLQKNKILIRDEIAFTTYYTNDPVAHEFMYFLQSINADLFIPIHNQTTIIGYIVVDIDSRTHNLYSDVERDEMVIFTKFIAHVIILLQTHRIESILATKKQLQEELYHKHQEIRQYKESIRSFLSDCEQREIGILFYKNRKFLCANQAAKNIIGINPSVQEGHPLAKAMRNVVKSAQAYQSTQTCYSYNDAGKRLVITALSNLEAHNIIILVHYPDIAHIIKQQIDRLNNPSEWDYLLYLETTQSGQLINQALPGNSKKLLNLKIQLLKCALTTKTVLIKAPEEDLATLVDLIHHMSLRKVLHIIKLEAPTTNHLFISKLFGISHIFGNTIEQPLIEKLDKVGTLFIQNIHYLDLETQSYIAHYLAYGCYKPYKGEQSKKSDVRIICSTYHDLSHLVQDNKLIASLYEQLKDNTIELPSLLTFNEEDLSYLANDLAKQAIAPHELNNFLELTEKERQKLIAKKSVSIHEFKQHIIHLLESKTHKSTIENTTINKTTNMIDPELIEAARLGRHALKDAHIMSLLWTKFKSQNKIATFLGVNRSSVNRRCKDYNLN